MRRRRVNGRSKPPFDVSPSRPLITFLLRHRQLANLLAAPSDHMRRRLFPPPNVHAAPCMKHTSTRPLLLVPQHTRLVPSLLLTGRLLATSLRQQHVHIMANWPHSMWTQPFHLARVAVHFCRTTRLVHVRGSCRTSITHFIRQS